MKYDVERLEADLLELVKAEFPAKLTEITAEKADSIVLDVPLDSEYFNSTDDEVNNDRQLSVRYGAEDQVAFSISSNTSEDNVYVFLVFIDDTNNLPGVLRKKLFRYSRALKEIFEENFDYFSCISNMKIGAIMPQAWAENEKSPVYKVSGVHIETSLAS